MSIQSPDCVRDDADRDATPLVLPLLVLLVHRVLSKAAAVSDTTFMFLPYISS